MDKKWFRELRCGAFIHWGLYAIPGGVWKGEHVDYIGEWLQALLRIPNSEYSQLASEFNPVEFDADRIVGDFARAGLKYIVFTAKHHDGFCMFDTKYSDYNSVKASPCHRDFVREFADACAKHGVKMGIYYSHCLDWHEKNGGDPRPCEKNMGICSWGNDWDFPNQSEKDFSAYFDGKVMPQIEELMTNYGPISVFWNDCPFGDITEERAQRILDMVHRLQPNCLVNSRVYGKKPMGDYGTLGDNEIPAGVSAEDYPSEAIVTLNDTWGFKKDDNNWKSPERIKEIILGVAQNGANLLVNFGPDGLGRIPMGSQKVLDGLANWMPNVTEALHCDGRNPFPQELNWSYVIAKGAKLWLFPKKEAGDSAVMSGISGKVAKCSVECEELPNGDLRLRGLAALAADYLPVCIEFETAPAYDQRLRLQNGLLTLGACQARLIHGMAKSDASSNGFIGAAGERIDGDDHSYVTPGGGLRNWKNTADSAIWECYLPKGEYSLRVLTRQLWHRKPWASGRVIRVVMNGVARELPLVASELETNNYYQGAYTDLGKYTQDNDGLFNLEFATLSEPDPTSALQLDLIEIRGNGNIAII